MKLIDKDALVAEIEKFIERSKAERVLHPKTILAAKHYLLIEDYGKLLSFIDTLEVKEVDLEQEYKEFVEDDPVYNKLVNGIVGMSIAKHFFELGLKAK